MAKRNKGPVISVKDLQIEDILVFGDDWTPEKTTDRCRIRTWEDMRLLYWGNTEEFNRICMCEDSWKCTCPKPKTFLEKPGTRHIVWWWGELEQRPPEWNQAVILNDMGELLQGEFEVAKKRARLEWQQMLKQRQEALKFGWSKPERYPRLQKPFDEPSDEELLHYWPYLRAWFRERQNQPGKG